MSEAKQHVELVADDSNDSNDDLEDENKELMMAENKSVEHLDGLVGGNGATDPSNANKLSEYTVDEAISWIGTGCFQFKLILITGLLWSTDAIEMMIVTILQPVIIEVWHLKENLSRGSLAMCVYGGMLVGTYILGTISDRIGRRLIIQISIIGYAVFSLLCAFSINYTMFLIMRFFVGICIGGGAVGYTLFAEFSPTEKRGRMLVIQQAFWCFGAIYASVIGWVSMEYLNFRYFLMFTSIPLWIVSLFAAWIPESPHYLMTVHKYEETKAIFKRMAEANNSFMPNGYLCTNMEVDTHKRGRISDVFLNKQYRLTSILLYLMLVTSVFSYFGLSFIGERIFIDDSGDQYKENLFATFGEILSLLIGIIVIDRIGRKTTLKISFIIYSSICLLLCFAAIRDISTFGVILIFIGRIFSSLAFMTQFIYFSEYYPTVIRATAIGGASSLDEISKILSDYLAQDIENITHAMVVFACVGIISLICSFLLPIETLGRQLNDQIDYGSSASSSPAKKGTMRIKLNEYE